LRQEGDWGLLCLHNRITITVAVLSIVFRIRLFLLFLLVLLGLLPLEIIVTVGSYDCFLGGFGFLAATVDAAADWETDAQNNEDYDHGNDSAG